MKVLCLGNEFIEGDSLAKKVGRLLKDEFDVVNIKDSFELMSFIGSKEDFVVIDVVQGLKEVKEIKIEDLRNDSILSAHDFDAGYVLKLSGRNLKIIGIPMEGDVSGIFERVLEILG